MASITWGRDLAEVYDATYSAGFGASVLDPMLDLLVDLAHDGSALEFAIGTGRVALPLAARGVRVHGVELSPAMVERLRAKPGADAVPVVIGDMTTTRVVGTFTLVYLVANSIMNVTTQDDQLAVLANAAAHLAPGGCFVVEVIVPALRSVPRGEVGRLAGLRVRERWADWDRTPFTSESTSQVVVFEKVAHAAPAAAVASGVDCGGVPTERVEEPSDAAATSVPGQPPPPPAALGGPARPGERDGPAPG